MSVFKQSESYRPFQYPWAVEAAKNHAIDMFWDVHQVELQDDIRQYTSQDGLKTKDVSHETNKYILKKLVTIFTEMDKVVAGGYTELLPYIGNNEIRTMLLTFAARETVHQRAYALAAEAFGFTDGDWSEFADYAEMRAKLDVMATSCEDGRDEYRAAVKMATILCGEGVGLFGAFSILLNYKRQGLLMGFNDVNQWSLIDEQDHVENNIKVLEAMRKELTEAERWALKSAVLAIVDAYVEAEHTFIDLVYAMGNQQDLTKEDLKDYISYLGELRKFQMGYLSIGEVRKNPLTWMDWLLSAGRHGNFFEKRITDYSHDPLPGKVDYTKYLVVES